VDSCYIQIIVTPCLRERVVSCYLLNFYLSQLLSNIVTLYTIIFRNKCTV